MAHINHGEAVLHRILYPQQNTIFLKYVKPNNNVFGIHLTLDL